MISRIQMVFGSAFVIALTAGSSLPVGAPSKLKSLYGFCELDGCSGRAPAGLLRDSLGNLYGAAESSGRGMGVVYELEGGKKLKILYGFPHDGSQGADPELPLIIDTS